MMGGTSRASVWRIAAMALVLTVTSPAILAALGPKEAAEHYRAERYREAVIEYRRVIAGGDTSEETLYNLGTALLAADSLASAIEVLERVARSRSEEVRYRAGFNLGLAHLRQGLAAEGDAGDQALDAALAAYKDVLLMRSDDADAKWNYELALRKKENNGGGGGGGGGEEDPSPSSAPDPSAKPEAPAERPQGGLGQGQAEQILNSAERDEREVQEKRRERAQPPKTRGKDW